MKISLENIEKTLIFLVFLSLPLSDWRTLLFGVPFYAPEILVFLAAVIHGMRLFGNDLPERRIRTAVAVSIGLIFFGVVSSMIVNGPDRDAFGAIKSWFLFPILFFWLVLKSGFSEKDSWKAVACWFFGVAFIAFISLLFPMFSTETYDGRLRSIFPSPNHFGFFLEYGVILGFGLMIFLKNRKEALSILVFSEAAIIAALLLTRSDGALVSALVGSAILFIAAILPSGMSKKILGGAFFFAALLFLGYFISSDRDLLGSGAVRDSLASRVMIWNASIHMIVEQPIFGIGPRNFQEAYLELQPEFPPYLEWAVPHPHNIVLSFWLFTGSTGLLGFAWLLVILFRHVLSGIGGQFTVLSGLLLGLLVAFCVHGVVDTPYFRNDPAYAFWSITALIFLLMNEKGAEAPKRLYEL